MHIQTPPISVQASRARLFKEYKEVQREKVADPDIQLVCDDSNIFKWTALIKGPSETPYEGGVFQLAFSVPEQYPLQPPQVRSLFHLLRACGRLRADFLFTRMELILDRCLTNVHRECLDVGSEPDDLILNNYY
ncbi:protein peroxin-4 [Tanacetum coccineum]